MKIRHTVLGLASLLAAADAGWSQTTNYAPHSPTARPSSLRSATPLVAPPVVTTGAEPWGVRPSQPGVIPTSATSAMANNAPSPYLASPYMPAPNMQMANTPVPNTPMPYIPSPYMPLAYNGVQPASYPAMRTAQAGAPGSFGPGAPEVLPTPVVAPVYGTPTPPNVLLPGQNGMPPAGSYPQQAYPQTALPQQAIPPQSDSQQPYSQPAFPPGAGSNFGAAGTSTDQNCGPGYVDPSLADPGYFDPGPRWFVAFGGIALTRTAPNGQQLAYVNTTPSQSVLNSRDTVNGQWRGGFEARIGRRIGEVSAIETTFWALDPFYSKQTYGNGAYNVTSTLDFVTNGPVLIDGKSAATFFVGSTSQSVERTDEVWSGEINWLNQSLLNDEGPRLSFMGIAGVRWFHFREGTEYQAVVGNTYYGQYSDYGNLGNYDIMTRNDLIGGQIGARMQYMWRPNFRFYATPKFGVYGNSISMQQRLHCGCPDGGTDGFNYLSHKYETSLLSQLDIGMAWQIRPRISANLGYRVLGVNNVALADDQYSQYVSSAGAEQTIHSNGSLIMHGATCSGQLTF